MCRVVTLSSFFVLLFLSIGNSQSIKNKFKYTGSSTIGNFILDANTVYNDAMFNVDTEPESAGGESAILSNSTDLAGSARFPMSVQSDPSVNISLIGWDVIAVIVNQTNYISSLSKVQLKGIFTGRYKNWKDVGGPDLEIKTYIVSNESATRKVFRSNILGKADYKDCEVVIPDIDLIDRIKQEPGAIGTISYSFLESLDNIKAIAVEGQILDLHNHDYPITRPLYLMWKKENSDVNSFVNWSLSMEGQRLLSKRFIGVQQTTTERNVNNGTLLVYTETDVVEDGGIYYYPHRPYDIYAMDGELLKTIPNQLSPNDESPSRISLNTGTYKIRVIKKDGKKKEYYISIQPDKLTKLNIVAQSGSNKLDKEENGSYADNIASLSAEINQLEKFKRINPYGDFRARLEQDFRDQSDRFRLRFRVRAGMSVALHKDMKLDLRMASSNNSDDPNSTHVNATDGFNQINIVIDRISFNYSPAKYKFLDVWLGKFSQKFVSSSVFSELVWDDDIQPEGVAGRLKFMKVGPLSSVVIYNGLYTQSSILSNVKPNWINNTQVVFSYKLNDIANLTLASGMYYHANVKGLNTVSTSIDGNGGNKVYESSDITTTQSYYVNDFHINDNFLLVKINRGNKDFIIKMEHIYNFGASSDNLGYAFGISYGGLKSKNDWKLYFQYQNIQQDAVFSPIVNDDFNLQTNYNGLVAGAAIAFNKKISLHFWYLNSEHKETKDLTNRFRLDMNVKI